jgi:hypothetical protein
MFLAAKSLGGNNVELTYRCEFSPDDYSGVPVNIYLGATVFTPGQTSSVTTTSPRACSVDEFLTSGNVYILDKEFKVYKYKKKVEDEGDDDDEEGGKDGALKEKSHGRSLPPEPRGGKPDPEDGKVKEPTWSGVSFPPVPVSGSGILPNVPDSMTIRFGVVLLRSSNGEFLCTDGLPVEMSNFVGPGTSGSAR